MAQVPKGRLEKGPYKPTCRDCAIYFSITVIPEKGPFAKLWIIGCMISAQVG